jgi:hypothetical protein
MQNSHDTDFDAPDAHFNKLCLFSDAQAKKFGNPKYYNCIIPYTCIVIFPFFSKIIDLLVAFYQIYIPQNYFYE